MLDVHLPWLTLMSEVLQTGELHYWNPYQELGYPFHADMLSTWYPPALLTARFIGFNLIVLQYYFLLHVFIAGCAMFKLLAFFKNDRQIAFLGAAAYMLCGVSVSNAQHLFIITSLAWIPFVLYYFLKTSKSLSFLNGLKLSLVACFAITGGYPFLTVVTIYFLLILFVIEALRNLKNERRNLVKIVIVFFFTALLTLVLCAPMIIAFIQVVPVLERGSPLATDVALSFPYTFRALGLSLIPFSVANNWEYFETDISMVNIYCGVVVAVFAIYGMRKRMYFIEYVFLGFGIVSLLGALARELPFMKWMVIYVPLFNYFRFPALFRLFFIIGVIVFAAGGIRNFLNSFERDRKSLHYCILLFIALALLVVLNGLRQIDFNHLTFKGPHATFQELLLKMTLYERIVIGGLIQLFILVTLLFVLWKSKNSYSFFKNTFWILLVDLLISVQTNINYTVVDPVVEPVKIVRALEETMPDDFPIPKRTSMLNARNEGTSVLGIWRNVNNFTKEPAVDGFSSFWLNDYLLLEKDTLLSGKVLDNPPVYLSSSVFSFNDLAAHKKKGYLHRKNIYLQEADYHSLNPANLNHAQSDTAYFLKFGPNSFRIKVRSSGEQVLTLLQSAYKGWHVTIEGKETSWIKSNYLFMSVIIPKGEFEVDFIYENKWVKSGFIAATITFFVILLAISWLTFREKKEHSINLP